MKIEHMALWTKNLEELREFYTRFFKATSNEKYVNPVKQFESYFLSFDSGARLELMRMASVPEHTNDIDKQFTGWIHLAFSVGSREEVDALTQRIADAGYRVVSAPRTTGDGYYESCVLDPDGNRIEITI